MSERTHEMTTWSDLEVPAVVDQMTADYHHCGSHQLALTLFMDRREAEQLRDKLTELLGTDSKLEDARSQSEAMISEINRIANLIGTAKVKATHYPPNGGWFVEPSVHVEWTDVDWVLETDASTCLEQVRDVARERGVDIAQNGAFDD